MVAIVVNAPYLGLEVQAPNPSGNIIYNYGICDHDVLYGRINACPTLTLLADCSGPPIDRLRSTARTLAAACFNINYSNSV